MNDVELTIKDKVEDKQEEKRNYALIITLLASVISHAIVLYFNLLPQTSLPEQLAEDQQPIELTPPPPEAPSPQAAKKQVKLKEQKTEMAETEEAQNRKIDPNAKFMSDRNQIAEKQMRAKAVDDFRQKKGSGLKSEQTKAMAMPATGNPDEHEAQVSKTEMANSNLEVMDPEQQKVEKAKKEAKAGIKRDWKTLSMKDLGVGGDGGQTSASDDKLEGVDTGERTILSTREYRYFSYYQRIKELLRQYWKPNVETKLYHLWAKGQTVGEEELVTRLLVLLDTEGKIVKISRVGSSGIVDLDQAAIDAFHQAGPFPNPPKGIVEADGFVRINWEFILKTEAAPAIQFSNAGQRQQ
jgi:TonB family protein